MGNPQSTDGFATPDFNNYRKKISLERQSIDLERIHQRCVGWDNSIDGLEKYCERLEKEIAELRRDQNVMMMCIRKLGDDRDWTQER